MARDGYKSYDLIAIHAGLVCGLKLPTVEQASMLRTEDLSAFVAQVADDEAAAKLRDELYVEFERRLRDHGYTGDQVWEWFKQTYGPISRMAIYRAREAARAHESQISEAAAQAQAFVHLARESGGEQISEAASRRAMQLYFQLLMELTPSDFADAKGKPEKIVKIIDSLAKLQKSRAESEMLAMRVAEMRRAAKDAVDAACAKTPDKALTRQAVYEIIDSIMRGEAA